MRERKRERGRDGGREREAKQFPALAQGVRIQELEFSGLGSGSNTGKEMLLKERANARKRDGERRRCR